MRPGGLARHSQSSALESPAEDVEEVTTVYVGNLPPEVDEHSLLMVFSYFGRINNVQARVLLTPLAAGPKRGCGVPGCSTPSVWSSLALAPLFYRLFSAPWDGCC